MAEQNYNNHSRYVPLFHFVILPVLLTVIVGSIVNICHSAPENKYSACLIAVIAIVLFLLCFLVRGFALRAQDRAIRAEENFRHFVLTGEPLSSSLTMGQIIALRFADDEELVTLAKKAADENLDSKAIKESIKNWRADNHRA